MFNENGNLIFVNQNPETKIYKGIIKASKIDSNEESYKGNSR